MRKIADLQKALIFIFGRGLIFGNETENQNFLKVDSGLIFDWLGGGGEGAYTQNFRKFIL